MHGSRDIAVIGAGITGLAAAWLLSKRHRVTLIEQEDRLGGHSNTVDVGLDGTVTPVDTGFIVYNTQSYPNLVALFAHLDVATARSDMSFAVSRGGGSYEYSGTGLGGIFGQPANLLNPRHLRMLADIRRFFATAPALLADGTDPRLTLGQFLARERFSATFIDNHILPMAAAIWSTPAHLTLEFPAAAFARFFDNHGLLQVRNRPEWRTVAGGSRNYVRRLLRSFHGTVITANGARSTVRGDGYVTIGLASGEQRRFDAALIATHADDALALLGDADARERRLLGAFGYQANEAVLHVDPRLMPQRRRVWSSWNYVEAVNAPPRAGPQVTYWMNRLQPLACREDVFVTLNPVEAIAAHHIRGRFGYAHPVFDAAAMAAQRELWSLQGRRGTWFAGSYFGYGFHEDGLQAGLAAAEHLGGVRRPWVVANESGRIHIASPAPDGMALAEAAE